MSNKSNRVEFDGGCHCKELNYTFAYVADNDIPCRLARAAALFAISTALSIRLTQMPS